MLLDIGKNVTIIVQSVIGNNICGRSAGSVSTGAQNTRCNYGFLVFFSSLILLENVLNYAWETSCHGVS